MFRGINALCSALFAAFIFVLAGCVDPPLQPSPLLSSSPTTASAYLLRATVKGKPPHGNGQKVGSCAPDGVSIADMAPGSYVATAATEVEHKVSFTLDKGEEKFIRCEISMGLLVGHANLELIDPAKGRGEIQNLSFMG